MANLDLEWKNILTVKNFLEFYRKTKNMHLNLWYICVPMVLKGFVVKILLDS